MKFSDILKTIGITTGVNGNTSNSSTSHLRPTKPSDASVDRIHHGGYQLYPYQHQMDMGVNPGIGTLYYPATYHMLGHRDYGLKLGGGIGSHHHLGTATGDHGHTGYGGNVPTTSYGGMASAGGGGYGAPGAGQGYGAPAPGGYDLPGGGYGHGGYGHSYSSTPRQKSKKSSSSVMTALTLLSFFFFINLLQSCLKEHMDAMNPTVMVMTAGVSRNRVSKVHDKHNLDFSRELLQPLHKDTDEDIEEDVDESSFSYPNITHGHTKIKAKLNNHFYSDDGVVLTKIY